MRISLLLLSLLLFAADAQANDVQLFNPDLFGQPTSAAVKLLLDKKSNEIEPYLVKTDIKCGKYYAASIFYRGKVTFGDIRAFKKIKKNVFKHWRHENHRSAVVILPNIHRTDALALRYRTRALSQTCHFNHKV